MKRFFDWWIGLASLAIAGIIGLAVHRLIGLPFWIAFLLAPIGMILNGLLAEWEDNRPGGFNNPG